MQFEKKEYKKFHKNSYNSFILGGDIGGTNTNLGIFGIKNNLLKLILSFHFNSKELKDLHSAVNETLDYIKKNYGMNITKACFGIAGVLSYKKDYAKITNVKWNVSKNILLKKTKLKKILLINDFEAIGYGMNMLTKKDIIVIKKAQKIPKATLIVIGAGTGLGKTTLIYNEAHKSYVPMHSEAGHSDFAAQNQFELELIKFIRRHKRIKQNISYELVLSGQGLINIYLFLRKTRKFKETIYTREIDESKNQPELISKYRSIDETCGAVFKTFKTIYAKFAKNFALDALPFGGVYVAGGIAQKNKEIFDRKFVRIFGHNYKIEEVLKKIPIYLISNYNVGLLGAGLYCFKTLSPKAK